MKPLRWLGAAAPGGLALPDAHPAPGTLYAPRGVCLNEDVLIAADTGNHRVLIWHGLPTSDHAPADIVLGQPDFGSEGPAAGGRGPANGLNLPTGVAVIDGRLFVCDAWHHRLLIWNTVPQRPNQPPDVVLGQPDFNEVRENSGGEATALSFYWPFGLAYIDGWFWVADTGNRRVLGWHGVPEPGRAPDVLLGQSTFGDRSENRGGAVSGSSYRWPHAIAGDSEGLYVADAGNHRVLGWAPHPRADRPADLALGQATFATSDELPHRPQGPQRLRFPYAVALEGQTLAVADTANNRVLFWHSRPKQGTFLPADQVIGQPDFDKSGENGWKAVTAETLCWPYGLHLHRGLLAVADSGNNRVMIWRLSDDVH